MQGYWNAPEPTVESTLGEVPGVKEVAVIAVPDKFNGKVVKAFSLIYHPHDIPLMLANSFAS
jgi:acyl-coenzyme A synthetase/AMP-(fatty) acid ligase